MSDVPVTRPVALTAFLLTFVAPGLGHRYAGDYQRGQIAHMVGMLMTNEYLRQVVEGNTKRVQRSEGAGAKVEDEFFTVAKFNQK